MKEVKLKLPIMSHPNCQNSRCRICLDDSTRLQDYLEQETGDSFSDLLGKYRSWLDKNGIFAETEWGWFSINVFEPKNIKSFINNYINIGIGDTNTKDVEIEGVVDYELDPTDFPYNYSVGGVSGEDILYELLNGRRSERVKIILERK